MNPLILHMIAGFAGIPDQDVDLLEKDYPAIARLCKTAQQLAPLIEKAGPLIEKVGPQFDALLPDLTQLMGLFKEALAIASPEKDDAEAIKPLIADFVKFLNAPKPEVVLDQHPNSTGN